MGVLAAGALAGNLLPVDAPIILVSMVMAALEGTGLGRMARVAGVVGWLHLSVRLAEPVSLKKSKSMNCPPR
jgi:hypothetical protein